MTPDETSVLRLGASDGALAVALHARFAAGGLAVEWVPDTAPIPGSYWGECEAGLVGAALFVRADTPVHSALHEGCHFLCADVARRATLHTDAGGDTDEECAVCYLSILMADTLPGFGRDRMLADMDAWGYSFRLGSARRCCEEDSEDARAWLARRPDLLQLSAVGG